MTWEPVRPEPRRSARLAGQVLADENIVLFVFQTTYSKQCSTVYDNKCQNIPAQECKAGEQSRKQRRFFFHNCVSAVCAKCRIFLIIVCLTNKIANIRYSSLLWPFYQTIYKNKCRYDKQCSTSYTKKCTKVGVFYYKAIRWLHFIFRFHKKTVKPFTTKNVPKSLRRIVALLTLRNASRHQNKTVRLFMINSAKKYPRTTAKMNR